MSQNRAYSVLSIKAVDEEQRVIKGTATTPTPDRVGDVVEPLGVKFKNPMPLLWQHKHDKPVGQVRFEKPTKKGIDFTAQLANVTEPGTLKDRVDEAWQSVKHGLVSAVSIGFKALEYSFMDDGGIHFQETEVMELSLVTIPANAEATISSIKSIDEPLVAASGIHTKDIERPTRPGVTGADKTAGADKGKPGQKKEKSKMPKSIAEQIAKFEATRAAKVARMEAIMQKASESGETLEGEEDEEYAGLEKEIAQIDVHLQRLTRFEKSQKAQAKAAGTEDGQDEAEEGSEAALVNPRAKAGDNSGVRPVRAKVIGVNSNVPKGTAFTRYVMALANAKGDTQKALNMAKRWSDMPEIALAIEHDVAGVLRADPMGIMAKAAVGPGTTTDATWASPLVAYNVMASEFIELLRPLTIIGRIPGLRRVPFNIQMPATTSGTSVGWVGENAPKPVSAMAFNTVNLRWAKAAGIVILTDELVRFSNPSAEAVVRQDLTDAMAQFLDRQFVDPAVAEVTNVSPASITNGVTPVTPTGTTASALRADLKTLFGGYFQNNLSTAGGVFLMTQTQALSLSLMQNSLGQPVFPGISAEGGTLVGYPVIASENLGMATGGSPTDGGLIIFLKASEIMLADDGQVVIDASNQASVQLDTAPDSPPSASTPLISLWQMNMTGVRAERWINWKKRRSTAVAYIQNSKYAE